MARVEIGHALPFVMDGQTIWRKQAITFACAGVLVSLLFGISCPAAQDKAKPVISFHPLETYLAEFKNNAPEDRAWELLRALAASGRHGPEAGTPLDSLSWPPGRNDAMYSAGVAFALDRKPELAVIREACARKVFGYDHEGVAPETTDLEIPQFHVGVCRGITRLLVMDVRAAVDEKNFDRACEDLRTLFRFSELLWKGPSVSAKLVSSAIIGMACAELSSMSAQGYLKEMSDSQLRLLLEDLSTLKVDSFRLDAEPVRRFLRDHLQRVFTDTGDGNGFTCKEGAEYLADLCRMDEAARSAVVRGAVVASGINPTRKDAAKAGESLIDVIGGWHACPTWQRPLMDVDEELKRAGATDGFLKACMLPITSEFECLPQRSTATSRAEMLRHAARIALAAELHRRKTGALPESLEQLHEALGGSLPIDAFTGEPLKYSVRDSRVLVYSVGNDRDDDGGRGLSGTDAYKAAKWCPAGDEEVVVDADYVLFPQVD